MRAIVAVVLAGCDVVFPTAEDPGDVTVALAAPDAVTSEGTGTATTDVTVTLTSSTGRAVRYRLQCEQGAFARSGSTIVEGEALGEITETWVPPYAATRVALTALAAPDLTFAMPAMASQSITVRQRIGHPVVTGASTLPIAGNNITAIGFAVPSPVRVVELGALLGSANVPIELAVYQDGPDDTGTKKTLIAKTPAASVTDPAAPLIVPIAPTALTVGRTAWIAIMGKAAYQVHSPETAELLSFASGSFDTGFPDALTFSHGSAPTLNLFATLEPE